jgi:hypothetical protein
VCDETRHRVIAALHASSVVSHRESFTAGRYELDLTLARPRLTPIGGDGTSVAIATRADGVVTRNDPAFDARFRFTAELTSHVRVAVKGRDDAHELRVALEAAPTPGDCVQLLTPLLTSQAALVRPALEHWMRQRPAAWPMTLPAELRVGPDTGPEVALRAIVDPVRRRALLWAIDSWVAAGTPVEARWTFGDGDELHMNGPGLRLVVDHTYAIGRYTPSLTLVDERGRSTTAQASVVIA